MLAALAVGGRLLVDDPVAGLMACGLDIITLVGVAAAGAGVGGVAHLGAGRLGHFLGVVMAQSVLNDGAAAGAELGFGAGGRVAGDMACGLVALQPGGSTADASVLGHALAGAGGPGDLLALIPTMPQRVGVVGDERTAAALADMEGAPAALTGGRGGLAYIVVRQRGGDVLDVALPTDGTLPQGVARAGTGCRNDGGGELMLGLGQVGFFHIAAPLTNINGLAGDFTGGVPDDHTLIGVAQHGLIVPLFNHAAVHTEIAVIAEGQAGGVYAIQQCPVVVLTAALVVTTAAVAVRVLAATVGIAAAAGAGAVLGSGFIPEMDIRHAVLHHVGVVVGVGDLVVHGIVPGLGVVGGAGQGAGVRTVAVADGSGHTGLGQVRHGDGVGLAVHHAEVVRNDGLGGGVGSFSIAAVGAGIHLHKAVMGQLRADGALHVVALQGGRFLLECAVAEPAVFAAGGDDAVILAVCLLNGLCFRQFLKEIVGAIVEPIDVLQVTVVRLGHVGVNTPAGFTHRFRPVVGGVIGVLAGYAVQNGTLAGAIYKGAVRVFHIPAHVSLAVPGIFRGAEHDKGSLLLADLAVECFVGHGGVGVQFVGAVVGLLPVLSGVVVTVLLGGKGGGHHADAQNHGQQQGRHALQAMPGCLAFQAFFPPFV